MLVISLVSCSSSYDALNIRFTSKFSGAITSGTEVPELRTIVSGYPSEYGVRDSVRPCPHPANCQICRIRTTCPPRDTQWLSRSRSPPLRDYPHPISRPSGKFPATSRPCRSTMLLFLLCHWPSSALFPSGSLRFCASWLRLLSVVGYVHFVCRGGYIHLDDLLQSLQWVDVPGPAHDLFDVPRRREYRRDLACVIHGETFERFLLLFVCRG